MIHKPSDPFPECGAVLCRKRVNIILFQCPPEPFNIDVVRCLATAIHADADSKFIEPVHPRRAGKLTSLIRVDNPGHTVLIYCPVKDFNHVLSMKAVMKSPSNNKTTVHVYDCR